MKHYIKLFFAAAVAALGLASCAKEVAPVETPKDNLVTVHFGATAGIEGATKATLTPNEQETLFTSAWENRDKIFIQYENDKTTATTTTGTWNGTKFEATMPSYTGMWEYTACYPNPANAEISFGTNRTQKGNLYNSNYDVMIAPKISCDHADAGKDDSGNDVVFNMERQTGIVYFHLKSELNNEDVISAKLSVEGGNIASSYTLLGPSGFTCEEDLKEITITFEEGTAPKASDFQLWYNVLPTMYTKMALTVETTGHTMTISRTAEGRYEAGRLYKVVKDIDDKWVAKGGETPTESSYTIEFYSEAKNDTEITNTTKASTIVSKGSEYLTDQPFTSSTKSYYGGTNKVLRVGTRSANGSITMDLSELGKCAATKKIILSAKQYTTGKSKTIGVGNSPKQQPGDDYTDLEFALDGSPLTSIKLNSDGYICVRSITVVKGIDKRHNINVAEVEGGTLSTSTIKAEEGTEITLTAEPQLGYEFNNDWSVTATDGTVINVVDNKFTMPAQDVTVSGTFSKVAYTITKAAAENGSFIVKNGDAEVTTAFKGDKITLEATPAEGFTFGKWTVTYMDGETEKSFNPSANTFNMPAANVTVSATFVETAHVPVYASVAELVAAGKPTKDGTKVTVTLTDEEITKLYKVTAKDNKTYTNGVFLMVGNQEVEIYCNDTPANWEVGGTISGTLTNCDWKLFVNRNTQKETWELCPTDYSELTYKAPIPTCATPEINIDENGVASITCATEGATIRYTVGDAPADPTETSDVFSSATLTDGQTIKAIAFAEGYKPSAVASKKVGGAAESVIVTKTMSSIVTENSYTISSGSNYGTIQKTLKIDDVIELSSTGGGNTGSFWGTAPDIDWRCYEETNSVVKISAKEGYIIEKFTLTFKPSNNGTLDGGKITTGTEYNVNAQSVSYKIGHSSGTKNGQIRITAISVTYKKL